MTGTAPANPLLRVRRDGAEAGKLFFAQVREDSDQDLRALADVLDDDIAVITSGGCTALALLAAGRRGIVHAVDSNTVQNDLLELKAAALIALPHADALALLGARPADADRRRRLLHQVSPLLGAGARATWTARRRDIDRGVLHAGVTERFLAVLAGIVRSRPWRIGLVAAQDVDALLAAPDLATQRQIFDERWDTRRWRAFLATVCHRRLLDRVYSSTFFEHTGRRDFADHFGSVVRHVLTELPARENPYVHDIFAGDFGAASPAYLTEEAASRIANGRDRLRVYDEPLTPWLTARPTGSLGGVALSNIAEWLTPAQIAVLFLELAQAVRPGGVVVMRNFTGWTDLPPGTAPCFDVDPIGEELSVADRSMLQYRIVVLRRTAAEPVAPGQVQRLDAHDPRQMAELVGLARSNPITAAADYVVDRSRMAPVLESLPGSHMVGLCEGGRLTAAATVLRFTARAGEPSTLLRVRYGGGLVADPGSPGAGSRLAEQCLARWRQDSDHVLMWLMNRDNPRVSRVQLRVLGEERAVVLAEVNYVEALPLRRGRLPRGWRFAPAGPGDEVAALTLIETAYAGHALAIPLTGHEVRRLPGQHTRDLWVLTDPSGAVAGAVHVWRPAPFVRIIPTRLDLPSRAWARTVAAARAAGVAVPRPPQVGEPILTLHLRRFAATGAPARALLVRCVGDLVLGEGLHTFSYVEDQRAPLPRAHRLVFAYPARLAGVVSPGSPVPASAITARPVFVDVSLT